MNAESKSRHQYNTKSTMYLFILHVIIQCITKKIDEIIDIINIALCFVFIYKFSDTWWGDFISCGALANKK